MALKACAKCRSEKPADLSHFVRHKQCRGGIGPYCRPCYREIQRAHKQQNRTKITARRRELYAERYGERQRELERLRAERFPYRVAAENLMRGVWERAQERSLPLSPELRRKEFVIAWLRRQPKCECCSVDLYLGPKGGQKHDASPSFDQIIPGAGYELANVALICWRCNNIKRNYCPRDLRLVAEWIEGRGNETTKFGAAA